MPRIASVFTLFFLPITFAGCGYQSAPKPPGYNSISAAEADGIPPVLSASQLAVLNREQLQTRATLLTTALANARRARNAGGVAVLENQLQATQQRIDSLPSQ